MQLAYTAFPTASTCFINPSQLTEWKFTVQVSCFSRADFTPCALKGLVWRWFAAFRRKRKTRNIYTDTYLIQRACSYLSDPSLLLLVTLGEQGKTNIAAVTPWLQNKNNATSSFLDQDFFLLNQGLESYITFPSAWGRTGVWLPESAAKQEMIGGED